MILIVFIVTVIIMGSIIRGANAALGEDTVNLISLILIIAFLIYAFAPRSAHTTTVVHHHHHHQETFE